MPVARHGIRVLGTADLDDFLTLANQDPIANVFALYRARTTSLEPRWLGGEVWGRFDEGRLIAACHVGANLVPIGCTPDDARAFAERALTRSRTATTIVGPHDAVRTFWNGVAGAWGRPRETRWQQPHMVITGPPSVPADELVRRTDRHDMSLLYPACVAMYTEEVGVSPESGGTGDMYRARVTQLMSRGWSFARFDAGRLVFKAEVACATPYAAQVQGVWVRPDRRGEGLAVAGMASVVSHVLGTGMAPVVSLYVNEWNEPARAAYARVGFEQTATFATMMF